MLTLLRPGLGRSLARSVSSSLVYRHALQPISGSGRINIAFPSTVASRSFSGTTVDMKESETSEQRKKEKTKPTAASDKADKPKNPEATNEEAEAKRLKREEVKKAKAEEKAAYSKALKAKKKEQALKVKALRRERAAKANEKAKIRKQKEAERQAKRELVKKKNLRYPVKRPLTAYQNFLSTYVRETVASSAEPHAQGQLFSAGIAVWNQMSEEEKAKYKTEDFDNKMKEYSEKYQEWKNSLSRTQTMARRRYRNSANSISAYSFFVQQNYPKDKGADFTEVTKDLAVRFKQLSEAEKQEYRERAAVVRAASREEQERKEKEKAAALQAAKAKAAAASPAAAE